jgi:hypothetical protein
VRHRSIGVRLRYQAILAALGCALVLAVPAAIAATYTYTGSITSSDPTQNARLFLRDPQSTCSLPQPGEPYGTPDFYHYDRYRFKNSAASTRCVSITLAPFCEAQSAAYSPSFDPTQTTKNVLGDIGDYVAQSQTKTYSVNVPAGAEFEVTVNEVNQNSFCSTYDLTVSGDDVVTFGSATSAGSITTADSTQTGRLVRTDPPSTCDAPQPASSIDATQRHYDLYRFRNTSSASECVEVMVNPGTCRGDDLIQSAAYSPNFNPTNVVENAFGDGGSGLGATYGIVVPPGATFDVVVNEVTPNVGCAGYTITVSGWGIQVSVPTGVTVASFAAFRIKTGVFLRWRAAGESTALGYRIYREQTGRRVRLTRSLIAATPQPAHHAYSWLDRAAPNRTVRYWLEEISLSGAHVWHGPMRVGRQ